MERTEAGYMQERRGETGPFEEKRGYSKEEGRTKVGYRQEKTEGKERKQH